ncbi:Cytochrome oxidase biogenesis protein Sco1/SenC/PrrC, thiol-disulfide reductase involved in Cu(I) insertion into CoxII Cu(A) center [hydrothermal vent metagenome]|uniref:Cytochrome oxidase biogenesis protein Sco1/SenC/PrrC, thiol-disulfide reductase involved in Cu(I) insertion into CoxII Cu(A) center n=1 Tax=hydrothermal vent metagenome TaxID=652676 RepID=A0A3B1B7J1_9ZZZZ
MNSEIKNSPIKALVGIGAVITLFVSVIFFKPPTPLTVPPDLQAVLWPEPRQITDFSLLGKGQKPFNLERLANKWTLLFLGYTNCPDVCPMTMSVLKAVYDGLAKYPEIQSSTQVVFISVDPARDSPEHIGQYVSYFDNSFIGATGTVEELNKFTRQLSAGYILEEPNELGTYQVNHTGSIYLIGPQQRIHGAFTQPHKPETIIEQYLNVLKLRDKK